MASFVETHCAATALFVTPLCTACVRGSGRKRRHTCSICLPSTLVGDAQRRALVSYGRSLAPHALGGCQPPAASGPPAAIAGSAYCCDLCWMDIRSRVSQRKPVATRVCGNCADSGESGRTSCGHISPRRVPLWCCFLSPPCLVDGPLPFSPPSLSLGPLPWSALSALQALFIAGGGVLITLAYRWLPVTLPLRWHRLTVLPLCVAGLWCVREVVTGCFPYGGFPWARAALSQSDSPFTKTVSWLGGTGLSFLMVALVAGLIEWLRI